MILSTQKLLQLVKEKKLVEGLAERELKNPEGGGFDLRVGEIYQTEGGGYLGIEQRKTPKERLLATYDPKKVKKINIKPGQLYLIKTIEVINQPENIQVIVRPRSTLARSGLTLLCAFGFPGYRGHFTFGLVNVGGLPFTLEMGARFCHAVFFEIKGKTLVPYRGQWQGGRVSARQKEKQI